jgi:hypothetical protein
MSVSAELLCSFELLKPLDSSALKNHIKKGRNKRNSMLNSPVSSLFSPSRSTCVSVLQCPDFAPSICTRRVIYVSFSISFFGGGVHIAYSRSPLWFPLRATRRIDTDAARLENTIFTAICAI